MKRVIKAATVSEKTYQNKQNPNKYVEVKKGSDGHSYVRQYMKWDTENGTVKNYNASKSNRGRYHRATQQTINQILEDYTEVTSATNSRRRVTSDTHAEYEYSKMSFDFAYDGDYDETLVTQAAELALAPEDVLGFEFESVDYSSYPEYAGMSISQCQVDFRWEYDYDRKHIEACLHNYLAKRGYALIGIDFESMNHAYKK